MTDIIMLKNHKEGRMYMLKLFLINMKKYLLKNLKIGMKNLKSNAYNK